VIRLLSRLVKWLESRFPEKVVVLESDYRALNMRLNRLEEQLKAHASVAVSHEEAIAAAIQRIAIVESSAVHKGAVADLVKVVAEVKTDFAAFKTSMGFRAPAANAELQAVFNGEQI